MKKHNRAFGTRELRSKKSSSCKTLGMDNSHYSHDKRVFSLKPKNRRTNFNTITNDNQRWPKIWVSQSGVQSKIDREEELAEQHHNWRGWEL